MDMSRMIFVTGFARGGTTWLRNCIGTHPEISVIGSELVLFRDHGKDVAAIHDVLNQHIAEHELNNRFYVEKSPANAPFVDQAVKLFPESKFVFIIRDPRDVFISHKRGTRAWMGGANKRVDGCMKKTHHYYQGYVRAQGAPNLLLVRYEDLHQNFHETIRRVFQFIGVEVTDAIVDDCMQANDFWEVASRHIERRDKPERKGVVGDWVNFLDKGEAKWFQNNTFWKQFMQQHRYSWQPVTYAGILTAMHDAGCAAIDQSQLLQCALDSQKVNILLCHDIDNLQAKYSVPSILDLARTEAQLGFAGTYFFLPLDDVRYKRNSPKQIIDLAREIQAINPKAAIGLHLNAAEKFFPASMPDADDNHSEMPKAIAYLHEQIDAYSSHGIQFKTATAHGYGRRKKKPNNRDSQVFTDELRKRGVMMWDTVLRPQIFERASHVAHIADVGGAIAAREMPSPGELISSQLYHDFPPGSLIHMLMHPGNYDVRLPTTLGRRSNRVVRSAVSVEPSTVAT